ncbi:MAG: WG repeat-containing protein [Prevotellaceae bacterium]|nr:WG repeat-containing protein [Prevotellaceae bacterium]
MQSASLAVVSDLYFGEIEKICRQKFIFLLNHKCAFIDKTGKEIIPLKYDFAGFFRNGLSCVRLNDKVGVINKKDQLVKQLNNKKMNMKTLILVP